MNSQGKPASNRVLFLCTGNYYRSRFAEIVFNNLARHHRLDGLAFSRALDIEKGSCNVGPISPFTRKACAERGLEIPEPTAFPCGVHENDFAVATRVIALKEAEHRRYVREKFPKWESRIEFWHVHDLDAAPFEEACAQIEQHVTDLIRELQRRVA